MWLPLTCPQLATRPATQACALTGNWTGDPLVCRPALKPLSYTGQGHLRYFFKSSLFHCVCYSRSANRSYKPVPQLKGGVWHKGALHEPWVEFFWSRPWWIPSWGNSRPLKATASPVHHPSPLASLAAPPPRGSTANLQWKRQKERVVLQCLRSTKTFKYGWKGRGGPCSPGGVASEPGNTLAFWMGVSALPSHELLWNHRGWRFDNLWKPLTILDCLSTWY